MPDLVECELRVAQAQGETQEGRRRFQLAVGRARGREGPRARRHDRYVCNQRQQPSDERRRRTSKLLALRRPDLQDDLAVLVVLEQLREPVDALALLPSAASSIPRHPRSGRRSPHRGSRRRARSRRAWRATAARSARAHRVTTRLAFSDTRRTWYAEVMDVEVSARVESDCPIAAR